MKLARRALFALAAVLPFMNVRKAAGMAWTVGVVRIAHDGVPVLRAALSGYSPVSGRRLGLAVEWNEDAPRDKVIDSLSRARMAMGKTLAYEEIGVWKEGGTGWGVRTRPLTFAETERFFERSEYWRQAAPPCPVIHSPHPPRGAEPARS